MSANMGNMTKSGSARTWEDTTKQISPGLSLDHICPYCGEVKSSKAHRAKADKCSKKKQAYFAEQRRKAA
jgi:hypothetical protein